MQSQQQPEAAILSLISLDCTQAAAGDLLFSPEASKLLLKFCGDFPALVSAIERRISRVDEARSSRAARLPRPPPPILMLMMGASRFRDCMPLLPSPCRGWRGLDSSSASPMPWWPRYASGDSRICPEI